MRLLSHFSRVQLFATPWTVAHLCPWGSPGKNTGVGCHVLLRGSSQPRDRTHVSYISCIGRQALFHSWCLGSPKVTLLYLLCIYYYICFINEEPEELWVVGSGLNPGCPTPVSNGSLLKFQSHPLSMLVTVPPPSLEKDEFSLFALVCSLRGMYQYW